MRIACIGEAMIELATQSGQPKLGVAGDSLNTAIYLKRCATQLNVEYVTRLGRDVFSDQIRSFILKQGVGTVCIETSTDKHPGLYAISTTPEGERSFTYWRSDSAAKQLFTSDNSFSFNVLDGFNVLYLSGITLAILPADARQALITYLGQSPAKVAFDSNYRPKLWQDQATAQRITAQMWELADILLPSVDDEMALYDETEDAVVARFQTLCDQTDSIGALKRGASGPLSLGANAPVTAYPPAPQIVDTTAAGDSFNGGYLASLLTGATQGDALMAGHMCAAHVVQHPGAIVSLP